MPLPTELLRTRTRQDLLKQRQQQLKQRIEQPTPTQPITTQEREEYERLTKQYDEQQAKLQTAISGVESEIAKNMATFQAIKQAIERKEKANPEYNPKFDRRRALEYANRIDELKVRENYLKSSQSVEEAGLRLSFYKGVTREALGRQREQKQLITERAKEISRLQGIPESVARSQIIKALGGEPLRKEGAYVGDVPRAYLTGLPQREIPKTSTGVISKAEVPKNLIERAKYYLAMEQGRLSLMESRGKATMGSRAYASVLTIPQTALGIVSLGLKSPEKAVKEVYQEGKGLLSPSSYGGIGGATHTEISKLGTNIFFTGALMGGGKLYSGGRASSLAKLETTPIKTIGVQVPTKTGVVQKSYGILKTDKNLFFADSTSFGRVAGDYGVARGSGYVYAQKISGKPISQTGYDYFGTTQAGGKAFKVKDYGVIKTKEPIGTGYIGKGGISETYSIGIKQRGVKIKAKGEFFPLGKPYKPTTTQAGTIKKIGVFEAEDIQGSVLGIISGDKVRMIKTSFDKTTKRVDPTRYITKPKDKTILFKIESQIKKDVVGKTPSKIKKTPLSKTFQEQKLTETFGIQEQTTKEMLFGTAKKVIIKQAEKKTAQVSLGTKSVSSLWLGKVQTQADKQLGALWSGGVIKTAVKQKPIQKEKEKIAIIPAVDLFEGLAQSQAEKQAVALKQPSAQKTKLLQTQVIAPVTITPTTPTPKIPLFTLFPRLSEASKQRVLKALAKLRGESVDVQVGMEEGKKKIVYKNLPPKKAYMKGQKWVDENIQASFKLVPTGKKTKKKDIGSISISKKFRPSKRDPLYSVEKRRYRLDMPKEKRQIQKSKRKKKIKWFR